MWFAPFVLASACAPHPEAPPVAAAVPTAPAHVDATLLAALLRNDSPRPLLVNVWAPWCGPCIDELPTLASQAAAHPGVNVLLVAVDADDGDIVAALRHAGVGSSTLHLTAPDPGAALRAIYPDWPPVIPVTLLIAPGGGVSRRFVGSVDDAELDAILRTAEAAPSG